VFWKAHAHPADAQAIPTAPPSPLAYGAPMLGLALIVALTLGAGPITGWLETTATEIHTTDAYIRAVLGN
jgi:multicomponent K+:H+ antiporter subunit D